MPKEVKVVVDRVLGAASIFRQGGSLRLILPKKAFKLLKIPKDPDELSDYSTVILIATNRGIILRPLQDYLEDEEMKDT